MPGRSSLECHALDLIGWGFTGFAGAGKDDSTNAYSPEGDDDDDGDDDKSPSLACISIKGEGQGRLAILNYAWSITRSLVARKSDAPEELYRHLLDQAPRSRWGESRRCHLPALCQDVSRVSWRTGLD